MTLQEAKTFISEQYAAAITDTDAGCLLGDSKSFWNATVSEIALEYGDAYNPDIATEITTDQWKNQKYSEALALVGILAGQ